MLNKELKARFTEELKKAWDSESMIKWCANNAAAVIEHNGGMFSIDKPSIEKSFCFGYGFCGMTTAEEMENADRMAAHAQKSEEYFMEQNLAGLNRWIKQLEDIREEMGRNWAEGSHPRYMVEIRPHYTGQTDDCKLMSFSIVDTFDGWKHSPTNDIELIDKLIEGYKTVKEDFTKRLRTYLKKYGMTKVRTWSYLSD